MFGFLYSLIPLICDYYYFIFIGKKKNKILTRRKGKVMEPDEAIKAPSSGHKDYSNYDSAAASDEESETKKCPQESFSEIAGESYREC